ncbi:TetR/AcrR family transcriptional regulator [Streptomyces sp. NPDC008159]|uniref:TetR/AcrR family transcriptional regulator n=1 Tax=Streptomyces sp. NPDC008159 TaxID=3364817 RepID=UPI0036E3052D
MIIQTTIPLIAEYGAAVTTAKVARAAGIGEGTIFRVFADRDELLQACLAEAFSPSTRSASSARSTSPSRCPTVSRKPPRPFRRTWRTSRR